MRINLILMAIILTLILSVGLGFAQQNVTITPQSQGSTEPEVQWVWGEVVSVDPAKSEIVVRYLDYETDTQKDITVTVNEKTTYENLKSIDEVKPKDALSIDYIQASDGKNLAKNISIEKPESATQAAPETEVKPAQSETAPAPSQGQTAPAPETAATQNTAQ